MKSVSKTLVPVMGKTYVFAPHPAEKGTKEKSQVKTSTKTKVNNKLFSI